MDRRPSLRPLLFALAPFVSLLATLVYPSAVAAQSASPTVVPTEPVGPTDGVGIASLGFILAALVVGGLLIAAVAGLVSVALIRLVGPFSDRVHLVLPVVIGSIPTAVLVNAFGISLLLILVLVALVMLPLTGLLLRRRYSRTSNH